jgi:hypothetical protein
VNSQSTHEVKSNLQTKNGKSLYDIQPVTSSTDAYRRNRKGLNSTSQVSDNQQTPSDENETLNGSVHQSNDQKAPEKILFSKRTGKPVYQIQPVISAADSYRIPKADEGEIHKESKQTTATAEINRNSKQSSYFGTVVMVTTLSGTGGIAYYYYLYHELPFPTYFS